MQIIEGNKCLDCGYELAGLTSDRCPECGRINEPLTLLASYREKQFGMRRTFFLCADRVVVKSEGVMGNQIEYPIRIATLHYDLGVLRARNKAFEVGVAGCLIGTTLAAVNLSENRDRSAWPVVLLWISIAVSALGFIAMLQSWKRVEFYIFRDRYRPEVRLLEIARRGPDVDKFEGFVRSLRAQIRRSTIEMEHALKDIESNSNQG